MITAVAGTCAQTTLSASDLQLSGGALALGQQTFVYSVAKAPQIAGCTFRITAVADTGASGFGEFTALLCQQGTSPTASACTPADGKAGKLVCAQNGLSYACVPNVSQNCTFNGQAVADGASVQAYPTSTVPYGQFCSAEVRTCANGVLSGSAVNSTCTSTPGAACSFNGQMIVDGAHVTGYTSSTVPAGQTCQSGTEICQNGLLIGRYTSSSCTVNASLDCSVNGHPLLNGQTTTVYQAASVSYGSSCSHQTLTCTNGVVSGGSGGSFFLYPSCSVAPAKDCTFNGEPVANGSSVTAYQNSVVAYGCTCTSEQRTCTNGSLSGSAPNSGCAVKGGINCSYGGQSLTSGSTTTGFAAASVAYGQTCSSISSTCTNGSMSPSIVPACSVQPGASCSYNGQTIADGTSVQGYVTNSVAFGNSCQSSTATCHNGSMSAQLSASCTVQSDPSCYVNGVMIADGSSSTFYNSASVPFGQSCQPQTRTCSNGSLSGSYQSASCSVTGPAPCSLAGQTIAHGASVTAYNSPQVPYGSSCQSASATCNNGSLALPAGYSSMSCAVSGPASCSFQGQSVAHGSSVTAFTSSHVAFGSSCNSVEENRVCNNGNLSGSGTNTSCSVDQAASCSFAGAPVAHGATVTAYATQQVPYGQTCQGLQGTCNNGQLALPSGYTYDSCAPAAAPTSYPPAPIFVNTWANRVRSLARSISPMHKVRLITADALAESIRQSVTKTA